MLPPKPEKFTPARGILAAAFSPPPELRKRRYTGRRLQGIRYERAVHEHLSWRYGGWYLASPWLKFFAEGRWRWCQPDGLLFQPELGKITIVEVKYQHTLDAWWQVRHLYQPVLEHMMPSSLWRYEVCEVVKWYDPAIQYPERIVLANEVDMPHHNFKVHIWKP
jgi:hypothetical protein